MISFLATTLGIKKQSVAYLKLQRFGSGWNRRPGHFSAVLACNPLSSWNKKAYPQVTAQCLYLDIYFLGVENDIN